jgi:hypothetical protein
MNRIYTHNFQSESKIITQRDDEKHENVVLFDGFDDGPLP